MERLNLSVRLATPAPASTHDTKDEQEQVHEVHIQVERADQCYTLHHVRITTGSNRTRVILDPLRIVGGQADENQHACIVNQPIQRCAGKEDIDDTGDDQTNQSHE